ncbi:MAG: type II toxin-antitoxin system RelE/ParE family toxin [Gammaproteobacteria bacterium]|nr:type II toxin-antitoxin system RelE/ParE family toxin [Gammaproteobacteria bacterium]MCF6324464.1 type II toxin-antitoxin system RelE/ParE family toxin [Gammaproteobacteria bacterium]
MSVFCTKWFKKWSKKSNLKDQDLIEAVANMEAGLSSSDLGNHLFKIRVKKSHSGKSSGFRTIVVYRENDRAIFLYGFAKNERENISASELQHFKKLGNDLLALNKDKLTHFVDEKILFDIEVSK